MQSCGQSQEPGLWCDRWVSQGLEWLEDWHGGFDLDPRSVRFVRHRGSQMKSTIWLFGSPRVAERYEKVAVPQQLRWAILGFEREWGRCWWTSFHYVSWSYYLSFNDQETVGSTNKSTLFQQTHLWGAHVSKLPKVGALWSGILRNLVETHQLSRSLVSLLKKVLCIQKVVFHYVKWFNY